MRTTMRTGQRNNRKKKKSRKGNRLGGVEVISPVVDKREMLAIHKIPHSSNKHVSIAIVDSIDRDIYSFEKKSLLAEFKGNQCFREAVMSGAYFYHQGRICLYHPDVFRDSKRGVKITDVIDKNPGDYLLSHYTQRIKVDVPPRRLRPNAYYRANKIRSKREIEKKTATKSLYNIKITHAKKYSKEAYREGKQYSEAVLYSIELVQGFIDGGQGNGPNDTFGEFLTNLMQERKLTIKQLADKTDIPERTIARMRSEEGYKPSVEYLLACCIVMKLPPWDSDKLFELAGIALRINNKKERCYIVLLHVFFKEGSIGVCDEVLSIAGLPTLSSIIDKNKKNK